MKKIRFLWNVTCYFFATIVSTVATSVMPLIIASIPFLVALFWILLWAVVLIVALPFSLLGEPLDIPMEEPIGIVLIPLISSALGVVTVSAAILLTVIFNLVVILPFSIFVEILNKRLGLRNWFLRLGTFLSGGIFLGIIVGIIGILLAKKDNTEISLLGQIGVGVFLGATCVIAEVGFGFTLMIADFSRKILEIIGSKVKNIRERRKLSAPT